MTAQELYVQIARDKLEEQYRIGRSLDGRAATVATIAAALSGVAALLLNFPGSPPPGAPRFLLASAIGVGLMLALGCCVRAIAPSKKKWVHNPPLDGYLEGFDQYPDTDPLSWTGNQIRKAVHKNWTVIDGKAAAIFVAMWCISVMGLLTLALGVAVNVGV